MGSTKRVIQFIDFKGISKYKFCKDLGFSNKFLDNSDNMGTDKACKILHHYPEINAEWLLTGNGSMLKEKETYLSTKGIDNMIKEPQTDYIPLIPIEAMAGVRNGAVQILSKDIIDGYVIPEFTQRGVEYIIRVSGSSMYPKYSSGDLLGCKTVNDTSFFQWGKIYVLDTDQGPMVKRLFPTDKEEYLECRSDNKEYPPFLVHKESIFKIAIVIGVLRLE